MKIALHYLVVAYFAAVCYAGPLKKEVLLALETTGAETIVPVGIAQTPETIPVVSSGKVNIQVELPVPVQMDPIPTPLKDVSVVKVTPEVSASLPAEQVKAEPLPMAEEKPMIEELPAPVILPIPSLPVENSKLPAEMLKIDEIMNIPAPVESNPLPPVENKPAPIPPQIAVPLPAQIAKASESQPLTPEAPISAPEVVPSLPIVSPPQIAVPLPAPAPSRPAQPSQLPLLPGDLLKNKEVVLPAAPAPAVPSPALPEAQASRELPADTLDVPLPTPAVDEPIQVVAEVPVVKADAVPDVSVLIPEKAAAVLPASSEVKVSGREAQSMAENIPALSLPEIMQIPEVPVQLPSLPKEENKAEAPVLPTKVEADMARSETPVAPVAEVKPTIPAQSHLTTPVAEKAVKVDAPVVPAIVPEQTLLRTPEAAAPVVQPQVPEQSKLETNTIEGEKPLAKIDVEQARVQTIATQPIVPAKINKPAKKPVNKAKLEPEVVQPIAQEDLVVAPVTPEVVPLVKSEPSIPEPEAPSMPVMIIMESQPAPEQSRSEIQIPVEKIVEAVVADMAETPIIAKTPAVIAIPTVVAETPEIAQVQPLIVPAVKVQEPMVVMPQTQVAPTNPKINSPQTGSPLTLVMPMEASTNPLTAPTNTNEVSSLPARSAEPAPEDEKMPQPNTLDLPRVNDRDLPANPVVALLQNAQKELNSDPSLTDVLRDLLQQ
jgi:hypothetical protein